jgi:hypothetical protein
MWVNNFIVKLLAFNIFLSLVLRVDNLKTSLEQSFHSACISVVAAQNIGLATEGQAKS